MKSLRKRRSRGRKLTFSSQSKERSSADSGCHIRMLQFSAARGLLLGGGTLYRPLHQVWRTGESGKENNRAEREGRRRSPHRVSSRFPARRHFFCFSDRCLYQVCSAGTTFFSFFVFFGFAFPECRIILVRKRNNRRCGNAFTGA